MRGISTTLKNKSELGSELLEHLMKVEDELDDGVPICRDVRDREAESQKKRAEIFTVVEGMPSDQLKRESDKRHLKIGFNDKSKVKEDLVRALTEEVTRKENLNEWVWGLKTNMLKKESELRELTGKTLPELKAQLIATMTPILDDYLCDPEQILMESKIAEAKEDPIIPEIKPKKIKLRKGRGPPKEESESVSQEEKVT